MSLRIVLVSFALFLFARGLARAVAERLVFGRAHMKDYAMTRNLTKSRRNPFAQRLIAFGFTVSHLFRLDPRGEKRQLSTSLRRLEFFISALPRPV